MDGQELKKTLVPAVSGMHAVLGRLQATTKSLPEILGDIFSELTRDLERLEQRIDLVAKEMVAADMPPAEVSVEIPEAWKPYVWPDDEPPPLPRERPVEEHELYMALWESRVPVFYTDPEGDSRSGALFGPGRGYVPRALYELASSFVTEGPAAAAFSADVAHLVLAAEGKVWLEKVHAPFYAGKVELADLVGRHEWKTTDQFMAQVLSIARKAIPEVMARWES